MEGQNVIIGVLVTFLLTIMLVFAVKPSPTQRYEEFRADALMRYDACVKGAPGIEGMNNCAHAVLMPAQHEVK